MVVICLDTFRADIVAQGGRLSAVATPNLDAFRERAVVFERAFGEGQPTLQTRRSLFTGRRSFPWRYNFDRRGLWHHHPGWHKIPPEQDTLAEILLRQGYCTGLVSDTYHMFKPTVNFSRGFVSYDFLRGQENDNWQPLVQDGAEEILRRHVRDPENWRRHGTLLQYLSNQGERRSEEEFQCARVFRRAAEWLRRARKNTPFFLWVDSFDPHEPWDPPRQYADRYFGGTGWQGLDFILPGTMGPSATAEERRRVAALYCGEVTFVDRWVGELLRVLTDTDAWRDTVVVFVSDHGTELEDDGLFGKGPGHLHPYNTQINWMVRHPHVSQGVRVRQFVQTHDLLPTVLSLLTLPPVPCDGTNAWQYVEDPGRPGRDHVVIGWADFSNRVTGARASVRTDEWNYVVTCHTEDQAAELYHLPSDPHEHANVAAAHPDVAERLKSKVEQVIGQSLPARFLEICDAGPAPISEYLGPGQRSSTL